MLIAYHNDPAQKAAILAQLAAHRAADELVKGQYWQYGKGCAIGCTLHSDDHAEYEPRFGIPLMLARLEDVIFEGLPNGDAQAWPERFMGAIPLGADLSRVGWKLLRWLLTTPEVNPGIEHDLVRDAVRCCVDVLAPLCEGRPVDESAAMSAAESAERAGRNAASAAASAAWNAANAARSAANAARSAARNAARNAARSAANAARSAARSAAWQKIADKLIVLVMEATIAA